MAWSAAVSTAARLVLMLKASQPPTTTIRASPRWRPQRASPVGAVPSMNWGQDAAGGGDQANNAGHPRQRFSEGFQPTQAQQHIGDADQYATGDCKEEKHTEGVGGSLRYQTCRT